MDMHSNKLDEIKKELQGLIEIIDSLESYDDIPSIDIDLLKHKMLNSYNKIIDLNKFEIIEQKEDTIIEEDTTEPEIELELIEKAEDAPKEAKDFYENVAKEIAKEEVVEPVVEEKVIIPEPTIEEIKEEVIEPKKEAAIVEEVKEETPEKKIINIDNSIKSPLVEIFNSIKNDSNNATIIQFSPISDVKSAISINERIGIISDIFSGDNNKFNDCLDKINNTEDINTVISELTNIADWDMENHNHKMFLEIIYRKFIDHKES